MAVAAHADDLEFGCAGSVASWSLSGDLIHYLILTDNSKGSEDISLASRQLIKQREQEQVKAAELLGVRSVSFAGFIDGELENTLAVRYQIVRKIRELRPDIVISTDPTFCYNPQTGLINHPDHRQAGQAALDSVFPYARNLRSFPELLREGLKPHIVREVLLINFSSGNYYVDITRTFPLKIKALKAHKSQLMDIVVAIKDSTNQAALFGAKIRAKYAESFVRISLQN